MAPYCAWPWGFPCRPTLHLFSGYSGTEGAEAESWAGGQTTAKENAQDLVQYEHQYLLLPGLHLICLMRYGYGHWSRLPARNGRAVQWLKTSLAGG